MILIISVTIGFICGYLASEAKHFFIRLEKRPPREPVALQTYINTLPPGSIVPLTAPERESLINQQLKDGKNNMPAKKTAKKAPAKKAVAKKTTAKKKK